MQINLNQLVASKNGLAKLAETQFKAKKLFEITKFVRVCAAEIESFDKVREEKIRQFGEENEINGKQVFEVSSENQQQFFSEIQELLDQEISLEIPEITLDDFGDIEMTPKDLIALNWLIKE